MKENNTVQGGEGEQTRIRLMPDSLANQIAAGEVVQRPASVVKELIENALDAGASKISLAVKDAGKALIQVTDDGFGMSPLDARMAFERHATSKILTIDDLFRVQTMGFRGEALASIAAVAQVELRTRPRGQELATCLAIEGGRFVRQESCVAPEGTTIAVHRLFFNVPARRNFLKSNPVELRHIQNEFLRIALGHPELSFEMRHNDQALHVLPAQSAAERVAALQPVKLAQLIPIEQPDEYLAISGLIAHPQAARGQRGEQYFWVNKRFIKSAYLHHAIARAYESVLHPQEHPVYYLHLSTDPRNIDINIHPTKTEIKFNDEAHSYQLVFQAVRNALREAMGQDLKSKREPELLPASNTVEPPATDIARLGQQEDDSSENIVIRPTRRSFQHEPMKWKGDKAAGTERLEKRETNPSVPAWSSPAPRMQEQEKARVEQSLFNDASPALRLVNEGMALLNLGEKTWLLHVERIRLYFRPAKTLTADHFGLGTQRLLAPQPLYDLSPEEQLLWADTQKVLEGEGYIFELEASGELSLLASPHQDASAALRRVRAVLASFLLNTPDETGTISERWQNDGLSKLIGIWKKAGYPECDERGRRIAVDLSEVDADFFFELFREKLGG